MRRKRFDLCVNHYYGNIFVEFIIHCHNIYDESNSNSNIRCHNSAQDVINFLNAMTIKEKMN
jgi:hypothetical protein